MQGSKFINGGVVMLVAMLLDVLVFGQGVDNAGIRQPESSPSPPAGLCLWVICRLVGRGLVWLLLCLIRGFRILWLSRCITRCGGYIAASGL